LHDAPTFSHKEINRQKLYLRRRFVFLLHRARSLQYSEIRFEHSDGQNYEMDHAEGKAEHAKQNHPNERDGKDDFGNKH
jgi:hypothetical protein